MFLTIKLYLCKTDLFEIELVICIKMDLVLNNQQRLICHKTQTTNRTIKSLWLFLFRTILIILSFWWSLLVLLFTSLPLSSSILWGLCQGHHRQLELPIPSCSTVFFQFSNKIYVLNPHFMLSFFVNYP